MPPFDLADVQSATELYLAFAIFGAGLLLRLMDFWRYRDTERVLRSLNLIPGEAKGGPYFEKRDDRFYAVIPYVWLWCDIVAAILVAHWLDHWAGYAVLTLIVGGRFRAIQEVSHVAVHVGLSSSKAFQWEVSNLLFAYPLCKAEMSRRFITHCKQHHPHPNQPNKDPNLIRFAAVGFVPGLSKGGFLWKLIHPLTPMGLWETIRLTARDSVLGNASAGRFVLRMVVLGGLLAALYQFFGWKGLVFGYAVPYFIMYPLFSWISVIAEHRWYVKSAASGRNTDECVNGRPTDYSGLSGWLVRLLVSPYSDSYHLAHSLYPYARWNHLPAIDRALKEQNPEYARYRSHGLFIPGKGCPSALSEVYHRMTCNTADDLADWAVTAGKAVDEPVAVTR